MGETPESRDLRGRGGVWRRVTAPLMKVQQRARSERAVRAAVESLSLPSDWSLKGLAGSVARRRGRPIKLVPFDDPCDEVRTVGDDLIYGLWIETDSVDLVMYPSNTTEFHQRHIVCHELGHMMLGHADCAHDRDDIFTAVQPLLPDLDPATVQAILARDGHTGYAEREAELFADLLMGMAAKQLICDGRSSSARFETVLWS